LNREEMTIFKYPESPFDANLETSSFNEPRVFSLKQIRDAVAAFFHFSRNGLI
jgi:hypothetical protein